MKSNRIWKMAVLAGGLSLAAPAAAKVATRTFTAPKQATQAFTKVDNDCLEAKLPGSWVRLKRFRLDRTRRWLVHEIWASAPNARIKVSFRCTRRGKVPFPVLLNQVASQLGKWIANFRKESQSIEQDNGRNVAVIVGTGLAKAFDPKTRRSVGRGHMVVRMMKEYLKRNLLVVVTIAATASKLGELRKILDAIGDSIDVISLQEKLKLKASKKG